MSKNEVISYFNWDVYDVNNSEITLSDSDVFDYFAISRNSSSIEISDVFEKFEGDFILLKLDATITGSTKPRTGTV